MKKILTTAGYSLIVLAVLITWIFSSIQKSGPGDVFAQDLLGLTIPNPPSWVGMVPYLGGFIEFLYSLFSLHGLVIVGVWLVCLLLAGVCLTLGDSSHAKT